MGVCAHHGNKTRNYDSEERKVFEVKFPANYSDVLTGGAQTPFVSALPGKSWLFQVFLRKFS